MSPATEPSPTPCRAPWRWLGGAVADYRRAYADRKAELLRRWVAGASDERLESVMRAPFGGVLRWQIFTTMRQRFDGDRASGLEAVVEFRIRRPGRQAVDRYQLAMAGGRCRRLKHAERSPAVTLEMDSPSFLRLVGGASGAPILMVTRRLKVRGDFLLAARLPGLLKIPRAPDERE